MSINPTMIPKALRLERVFKKKKQLILWLQQQPISYSVFNLLESQGPFSK